MRLTSLSALALAAALLAPLPAARADTSAEDRQFLRDAVQGDLSEISLGKLAERRGASPGVRRFGNVLVRDHSDALVAARRMARELHETPPQKPKKEALAEYRKLEGLRGRAFDKEFASYMVDDHKKDVADFSDEARKHGPLADMAGSTVPVLKKHLRMAQALER